jgi:hypothetical protein
MPRPRDAEVMVRSGYRFPAAIKKWIRERACKLNVSETQVLKEVLYCGKKLIEESERTAPSEARKEE